MKLFIAVLAIYFGISAVITFISCFSKEGPFPVAPILDIVMSVGFIVWAIVLLTR